MSRIRRAIRGTSSAQLAEHPDAGYSGSGESIFSRHAAHGEPRLQSAGPAKFNGRHTLSQLIAEVAGRLRHMEAQLRIEDSAERRQRLEHQIDIKAQFLARLRYEQMETANGKSFR